MHGTKPRIFCIFTVGGVGSVRVKISHSGCWPPKAKSYGRLSLAYCSGVSLRQISPRPFSIAYSSICRLSDSPNASHVWPFP